MKIRLAKVEWTNHQNQNE